MSLFSPSRRLFSIASIATIVVAILHTIGNTASSDDDSALLAVLAAMRGHHVPLGIGMSPSIWDIYRGLVFTMSVCLLAIGVLGLVLAADPDSTPRLLSRSALVLAVASAALTIIYAVYQIPPSLISMAIVTALYAGAVKSTRV